MQAFLPEPVVQALDATIESIYGLAPMVEPTVVLVPSFVPTAIESLAEQIGQDATTLNFVLGMFLCYPLGLAMNALPFGQIRHAFSFLLGAFVLQWILGVQWIHHLISSLIVYAMLAVLPKKTCTTLVPVFVMGYLTLGHLHRQYVNYLGWDLDFTGSQMVLTQKLYMLAFNLYDGEVLAQGKESRAAKKCAPFALDKLPGLIEYLGYTFCFSNLLAGPAYEYVTYAKGCDGSLLYTPDGKPRGTIPSNLGPTMIACVTSIVCLGLYVVGGSYFPLLDATDPQGNDPVLIQEDFLKNPWVYRYAYMWCALVIVRMKYYFAWKNAEGASNAWYVGFEGFDEKGNALGWDNASNVDIIGFETAPNVQTLSKEWNKKTSLWLQRYVYFRTNGSLVAVYSTSAFWHGFYPGYYLFFLSVPILTFCERLAKKKISPMFDSAKWSLYGIGCMLVTSFFVEYMVSAFVVLALGRAIAVWRSHFFFGHIGAAIGYGILMQLPTPKKKEA